MPLERFTSKKTVQQLLDANASKLGELQRNRLQGELDRAGEVDGKTLNALYDSIVRASGGAVKSMQNKDGNARDTK